MELPAVEEAIAGPPRGDRNRRAESGDRQIANDDAPLAVGIATFHERRPFPRGVLRDAPRRLRLLRSSRRDAKIDDPASRVAQDDALEDRPRVRRRRAKRKEPATRRAQNRPRVEQAPRRGENAILAAELDASRRRDVQRLDPRVDL